MEVLSVEVVNVVCERSLVTIAITFATASVQPALIAENYPPLTDRFELVLTGLREVQEALIHAGCSALIAWRLPRREEPERLMPPEPLWH